ncbi:hypothetical protein [Longimicrobium sp.]|uniref:hypothetical protein n=1 Tax=Longimicrobium sp. TaxID=2029185 RepID=UPI003B3A8D01
MIVKTTREMSAEERATLHAALQPPTFQPRPFVTGEGWLMVAAFVLVPVVLWFTGERSVGGYLGVLVLGAVLAGYHVVSTARANARQRRNHAIWTTQQASVLARLLDDGRVVATRVRAAAAVQIEPWDDEGTGYLFDLGDGRVLVMKGDDYFADEDEEEARWPNTDFEVVRAVADRRIVDMRLHGSALYPARVLEYGDYDWRRWVNLPAGVLDISLDEAVRSILPDHPASEGA